MPVVYQNATTAGLANPAAAAETVVFSSALLGPTGPGTPNGIGITGWVNLLAGTGTTAVVVRVRQGNTTGGAQQGPSVTQTLAAGSTGTVPFAGVDFSNYSDNPTGYQYCVTVQQTGGTGAGTTNSVGMVVQE